jgi:uncharacterized membrane protein
MVNSLSPLQERPQDVVFHARLKPYRSLGRRGTLILFACVSAAILALSMPFYLLGAWPVAGFLGLDLLALWLAFRISNARARAYEELVLTHLELIVSRVTHLGRRSEWRFNPVWVRVRRDEHPEFGTQRVVLVEGKRAVEMAAFLGAEEKADFAGALTAAIAEARRGPTLNQPS